MAKCYAVIDILSDPIEIGTLYLDRKKAEKEAVERSKLEIVRIREFELDVLVEVN